MLPISRFDTVLTRWFPAAEMYGRVTHARWSGHYRVQVGHEAGIGFATREKAIKYLCELEDKPSKGGHGDGQETDGTVE